MSVYLVALINIENRDEYAKYESGFMEIFSRYKGELVAVDEKPATLEGEWPYTRTVLIRFPDEDEAKRWYNSDAYQALARHRLRASRGNIALIKGLA